MEKTDELWFWLAGVDRPRSRALMAHIGPMLMELVLKSVRIWCGHELFMTLWSLFQCDTTRWPKKNFMTSNLDLLTESFVLCPLRLYALGDSSKNLLLTMFSFPDNNFQVSMRSFPPSFQRGELKTFQSLTILQSLALGNLRYSTLYFFRAMDVYCHIRRPHTVF